MPTNNFKLFDENKTNILTDSEYAANTQRQNGVQTGVASSKLNNKFAYQTSLVAYAIAQIMNANGQNASDSDAVATFVANLQGSLVQKVVDCATSAEAVAGVINNKFITPATMKAAALLLSGGTLTGPLTLAGDPTLPLHAATKQYVDEGVKSEKDHVGDIKSSVKDSIGGKYILADGSVIDSSKYPELYSLVKGGSFEQGVAKVASQLTLPNDNWNIYYSGILNGVYFIVINISNSATTHLVYSIDPENGFSVKTFTDFSCKNINYCNGYYVMVGNNQLNPSTSDSGKKNQKVIIKYTTNPFTTEFSTKEITGVQGTTYYWHCATTNMVYGNSKYYIVCNLYYDNYSASDTVGHLSSDTIDGNYVATKTTNNSYTTYTGSSGAYFDESSKLFFANMVYTRSGYQNTRGIVAFTELFGSEVGTIFATDPSTSTVYSILGLFDKLDENVFVCTSVNASKPPCIFSVGDDNTLKVLLNVANLTVLNNGYVPIAKNVTATSEQGKLIWCNQQQASSPVLLYIENSYTGVKVMYSISNAKDAWRFLFFSKDGTKLYYTPSTGSTSTIQVKYVEMKNYLPTITNDNYNTFIRALE